jgi:hypothetical protein
MKKLFTVQSRRSERLLAVHAAASATLHKAITAPSPLLALKAKKRATIKARSPGYRSNRPFLAEWMEQERLPLEHPADHHPAAIATPEAAAMFGRHVTLSTRELHILLCAALPAGRTLRTRRAHARIRDAMESFADALGELRGNAIPDSLVEAAQVLATATDAWLAQAARARQAEEMQTARWKARAVSISSLRRAPETIVPAPFPAA